MNDEEMAYEAKVRYLADVCRTATSNPSEDGTIDTDALVPHLDKLMDEADMVASALTFGLHSNRYDEESDALEARIAKGDMSDEERNEARIGMKRMASEIYALDAALMAKVLSVVFGGNEA